MTTDIMMRKTIGWVIFRVYYMKGKKLEPISVTRRHNDTGIMGYVYIYPTKKCAELDMWKLRDFNSDFEIHKVKLEMGR